LQVTPSSGDEIVSEQLKSLSLTDPSNIKTTEVTESVPVKVAWSSESKINLNSVVPSHQNYSSLLPPAQRPTTLCHYSSAVSSSQPPNRTYAAPKGEEGMFLHAVLG